jgi:hypothetical protein
MTWALALLLVFVSPVPAYRCSVCPAGKYKSGADFLHLTCFDCAEGTYAAGLGATACVPCGLHSSAPRGSSTCVCDAGYAKDESGDCRGCSDGLVLVDAKCECPSGSSGPSSGPCASCAAGKFQDAVGRAACEDCPMHTYQTQTGARNCTACPGALRASAGSTSPDMCECGVGFLKRTDDTCEGLLPRFVEVRLEVQTTVENQTRAAIVDAMKEAVVTAWISEYNVSREYLIVEVFEIVDPARRLLATTIRYVIVVRRIFPAETSEAFVDAVVLAVANFSAADVEVLVPVSGPDLNVTVNEVKLQITGTAASVQAIVGVLNLRRNEVVTCALITWQDAVRGPSQVCDKVCAVDQDTVAVAFLDGQFVLSCVDRRAEAPVQTTPPPLPLPRSMPSLPMPMAPQDADWVLIFTVVGVGVPAVLVILICRLRRKNV